MKRFNFNNKPIVESPYPPQDLNVLWADVDESTGKVSSISAFKNGTWKIILQKLTGDMYKVYVVRKKDISNCTYNMVDLGLSVKWADRNVGATSPEHYGSYFQWGDTDAYTFDGAGEVTAAELASLLQPLVGDEMEITADNVGMILEQMGITGTDLTNPTSTPMGGLGFTLDKAFDWSGYFDTTDGGSTFNKYNNNGGLTVLEPVDDAAAFHMGTQYRMPTSAEIEELISGTTQTFIDLDGNEYSQEEAQNGDIESGKLKGVRFTGSNGNSIFIPAAGDCTDSMLMNFGTEGSLRSSSLFSIDEQCNDGLRLDCNNVGGLSWARCNGGSVRGVQS